jgi:hypothetical protein
VPDDLPPWRYRRILVYASWLLGLVMIGVGVYGFFLSEATFGVASELVVGGVALISIVLSAYVGAATWQDINLWRPQDGHDIEMTDELP